MKKTSQGKIVLVKIASLLLLTFASGCTRAIPDRIGGGDGANVSIVANAFKADAAGVSNGTQQLPEPTGGWATITGKITVQGTIDQSKFIAYAVTKDNNVCSTQPNRRVVINGDALQWGLIFYDGPFKAGGEKWEHPDYQAAAGRELTGDLAFDQKQCIFLSRVYAMRTGQILEIKNSDPVGHNAKLDGLTSSNQQIGVGASITYTPEFQESKPFGVSCSSHPWMSSYMIVRDAPFFAVSGEDGTFQIANVPTGIELPFKFWHEVLPSGSFSITLNGEPQVLSRGKFILQALSPGDQKELNIVIDAGLFNDAL